MMKAGAFVDAMNSAEHDYLILITDIILEAVAFFAPYVCEASLTR